MKEIIMWLFEWLVSLGYTGIALGLMVEVIPSEIVLSYAGFLVGQHYVTFNGALIAATIGGTLAQLFLYWLGYYGGRPLVEKYGKYILISDKQIQLAERWFQKYGVGVIFFARFIPIVRHAISIPAGIARMNGWRFTLYTILAVIPWSIFFMVLGLKLGSNWQYIKTVSEPYMKWFFVFAFFGFGLYILFMKKRKRKE